MIRAPLVVAVLLLAGCGFPAIEDASCPTAGTPLTYENFGKDFFNGYCARCHNGYSGYTSRTFNTVELVRAQRARIYANATGENAPMPPGPEGPTREERHKLAEWLVCGAP